MPPLHEEALPQPVTHANKSITLSVRTPPLIATAHSAGTQRSTHSNDESIARRPPSAPCTIYVRVAVRTIIYLAYDGVGTARKESARILKAVLELLLDEAAAPPARRHMSVMQKLAEYVAPPAASSLAWCALRQRRVALRALFFAPAHRAMRHLLIHRLFFKIGTRAYTLASALGILCCFFREALLGEIHRLRQWPVHFAPMQGAGALLRSALYALSFAMPLSLAPRRRAAVKKVVFAIVLAYTRVLGAFVA